MAAEGTLRLLQLGHSSVTAYGPPTETSVASRMLHIWLNCVCGPMTQKQQIVVNHLWELQKGSAPINSTSLL